MLTVKFKKMSEFILIFRRDYGTATLQPTPESLQKSLKDWAEWYNKLAAEDKLARPVQRLDNAGRILRQYNSIENGPYKESMESIGGMIIIKAADYDDAIEVAKGCPVLAFGGNVEIRMAL